MSKGFWSTLNQTGCGVLTAVSESSEIVANYATAGNAISKKVAVKCIIEANREIEAELASAETTVQAELDKFSAIKLR